MLVQPIEPHGKRFTNFLYIIIIIMIIIIIIIAWRRPAGIRLSGLTPC